MNEFENKIKTLKGYNTNKRHFLNVVYDTYKSFFNDESLIVTKIIEYDTDGYWISIQVKHSEEQFDKFIKIAKQSTLTEQMIDGTDCEINIFDE